MKLDFFQFYPPSTFLSVRFGLYSFNKLEKKIKKLKSYFP